MQHDRAVGIVGGGPGGLTLAKILSSKGITPVVFELDEHPLSRPQGGSLDLHAESGLRALREAGLWSDFEAVARYDDQADYGYDQFGTLYAEHDGRDGDRPEIDRTQLRDILLRSLPDGVVRWGSKVARVQPLASGAHRVVAEDGSTLGDFELVVGADGAWSRVRPLLSQETPAYTGVTFVELQIDDVDTLHPAIAKLLPRGKLGAIGRSRGIIAQRSSGGHVRVYVILRVPEGELANGFVDVGTPALARERIKALLPDWSPTLLALVDASSDTMALRPIVALAAGHRWDHVRGVTLLGDAAHVMTPFSGEGVNMAMLDALELGLALASSDDWDLGVARFEAAMFERAGAAAAGAMEGLTNFVSDDALERLREEAHAFERARVSAHSHLSPLGVIQTRLRAKVMEAAARGDVRASYRFDLSGPNGGSWIVDLRSATAGVRASDEAAPCTVAMADEDFVRMVLGELAPRTAFRTGRLKVRGDMGLAMKLGDFLR